MPKRNITLKLTMDEVNRLVEVIDFMEVQELTTEDLIHIRKNLEYSKSKAIQRGCSRAPAVK